MTPALIESTGAASGGQAVGQAVDGAVTLSPEEHNELLQRAFKEGARLGGNQGRFGLGASVAQVADWLRLAGAQNGREHDLAPKERPPERQLAESEPACFSTTGADYAAAQIAQQRAPERENILVELAVQNEGKMEALAARIEELKNREYRCRHPPLAPALSLALPGLPGRPDPPTHPRPPSAPMGYKEGC